MHAVCPKDSDHAEFIATGYEEHDWLVDEHGSFIADLSCGDTKGPDMGSEWRCAECGAIAEFGDD